MYVHSRRPHRQQLIPFLVELGSVSFNLSKATKLGEAVFRLGSLGAEWITTILKTITPKHRDLQHISIYMPRYLPPIDTDFHVRRTVGEETYRQWLDLDRLLLQFWESRSIRPKVERDTRYYIECLLPAVAGGGMVDMVE